MFDVLFIYCTVVCRRFRRANIRIHKTLSSLSSKACVLDACCTYFLYLSIGLHASNLRQNCGNIYVSYLSMYYPCYPEFG
jgi:hypothetical protein